MRLRSLELENFRRHRHTRLDFQDGVTALVGPNGAGKSTLIEAVGFALFGPRAAGTGKDLIRSETAGPGDSVKVALELEVGGQAVRVVRELRGRPQSPMASLEVDGHVQVQPIAGSSDQATLLVERLLGLDRDGFFQTVVARQGELDRLARLKPAERRAFVLDLVGIGAVDAAITRARESRNALKLQADEAARHVGDPAALGARVAAAQQADASAAAAAKAAEARKVEVEALAVQASARHEQARQAANERAALDHQAALLTERAAAVRRESERVRLELVQAEAQAARLPELRAALATAEPFEAQLANAQGLVLVRQQRTVQVARIAQQTALLHKLTAEAEAIVAPPLPEVARLAAAAEACQAASVQAERERAVATERASQARQAAAALSGLQGGKCPSCQQPVTAEHLAAERAASAERLAAAEAAAAKAVAVAQLSAAQVRSAREAVAAAQVELRRGEAAHRRKAELAEQAATLRTTLVALEEALPADPGPITDLAELQRRAEEAKATRLHLATADGAATRLPTLRKVATDAERAHQAVEAELGALTLRLATQPDAATALRKAKAESEQAWTAAGQARSAHTAALLAAQAAQAGLELALAEQARDASARERLLLLQKDLSLWTAVVGAAGGGLLERFREHLVSRTAPAINQEASHLLSLFTQGRYTELVLDESYEVWMGDGGVLHPIERFSGGEQDLAHLALRLGISRLLATRANAPEIRFLALDEVFSSLDSQRCTALLGALQNLGGLYSQVLAVTHLERLQESFDGVARVGLVDGEAQVTVHTG